MPQGPRSRLYSLAQMGWAEGQTREYCTYSLSSAGLLLILQNPVQNSHCFRKISLDLPFRDDWVGAHTTLCPVPASGSPDTEEFRLGIEARGNLLWASFQSGGGRWLEGEGG